MGLSVEYKKATKMDSLLDFTQLLTTMQVFFAAALSVIACVLCAAVPIHCFLLRRRRQQERRHEAIILHPIVHPPPFGEIQMEPKQDKDTPSTQGPQHSRSFIGRAMRTW